MKLIIFASDIFSITGIKTLVEHNYNIVAIMTTIDAIACKHIEKIALKYNIPYYKVNNINSNESFSLISSYEPDIIFTCNFHKILNHNIFSIAKKYAINIHPSLLPKYKGLHPIQEALFNGEKETGITLHFISEKVDEGDIISQIKIPIDDNDYIYDLHVKFMNIYPGFIISSLGNLLNSSFNSIKQINIENNYVKFDKNSNIILDSNSVITAVNKIKAFSYPYGGAQYKNFIIWKAFISSNNLNEDYLEIKLIDGSIFIPKQFYELKSKESKQVDSAQTNGGGIISLYNNYILNIFIDIINLNSISFETNIYEYCLDMSNFDFGFYAYDSIILFKIIDNYIKCFYYGYENQNIASALKLLTHIPYKYDYILEIQYKHINKIDSYIESNFQKISSLVKLFKKSSYGLDEFSFPIKIKFAEIDDAAEILNLQHSIFDKYIERNISMDKLLVHINQKTVFIYKKNNEILGCIISYYKGKFAHLDYIFINPKYRNLGIGNHLFSYFLYYYKQFNIELWCREDNTTAINLYKKYNLKPTGLKSDIYIYKK